MFGLFKKQPLRSAKIGTRWIFKPSDPFQDYNIPYSTVTIIAKKDGYVQYKRDSISTFFNPDSMKENFFVSIYQELDSLEPPEHRNEKS